MIWQSVPLMTIIDVVIIVAALAATWVLFERRSSLSGSRRAGGPALIVVGLAVLSLLHLADLFAMHGLPLLIGRPAAAAAMETLHLNYSWVVTLLAAVCILLGFTQTQRELEEKERRLELAVAGSNDGMWDLPDANRDEAWWSPRWYELLGYEDGEVEASFSNFKAFLHPDDLDRVVESVRAHFEEHAAFDVECRLRTKSGEYGWFRDRGRALWDQDGRPVRMSGSIQDITDRKQAEEERQRYEAMATATSDLMALVDTEYRYRAINQAYRDQHRRPPEEILGLTAAEVFGEKVFEEKLKPGLDRCLSGEQVNLETWWDVPSRGRRHLDVRYDPFYEADGSVSGVVVALRDTTDRKQAEDTLRSALEWLEAIVEGSRDAIFISDIDSQFVTVNVAATQLTGYSRGELLEMRILDLHEEADQRAYRELHDPLMTGEEYVTEAKIRRKDGTTVDTEFNSRRISIGGQKYLHRAARDVSGRKHLERGILEISERERRWAGLQLHDGVGQQLTGVGFLSRVLERKLRDRKAPEVAEAARIVELVQEATLDAQELARGLYPADLEVSGLLPALEEMASRMEGIYDTRCRIEGEPVELSLGREAETHLYRIAQEAALNAVKHGQPSSIVMRLTAENGRTTLTVEDNGSGIAVGETNGGGMGIDIMRYRARMLDALFSIRPNPDGGTIVECSIFPHERDSVSILPQEGAIV